MDTTFLFSGHKTILSRDGVIFEYSLFFFLNYSLAMYSVVSNQTSPIMLLKVIAVYCESYTIHEIHCMVILQSFCLIKQAGHIVTCMPY